MNPKNILLCGMERISREGLCNSPATHIWKHKDGETPVCDRCIFSVIVNDGHLIQISKPVEAKMKHLTETEFNDIVANGKMFQLTSGGESDMFFGTQDQFADCFFANADYWNVCDFAEKNGCFVVAAQ